VCLAHKWRDDIVNWLASHAEVLVAVIALLAVIAAAAALIAHIFAARRERPILQALADANRIVENSTAVLFRLEASPSMPMTYVSDNIAHFGHDGPGLVAGGILYRSLIHPDDRAATAAALAGLLDAGAKPSIIEFRLRTGGGSYAWVEARCRPVHDRQGRLQEIEGVLLDVTERKEAAAAALKSLRMDALTGLANRAVFFERIEHAILAARRGAPGFAVLFVDLDHFKEINDYQGHDSGDALLKAVAERLAGRIRVTDLVARMGGDEFVILQSNVFDPADAGALAAKLLQSLAEPVRLEHGEILETASIGIAIYSDEATSAQEIVKQADIALYRAKAEGRNRFCFFRDGIDVTMRDRVALGRELQGAIASGQMRLLYQPQVELASRRIVGFEALLRWHHPTRGVLPPSSFLAMAGQSALADQLCRWSIQEACRQLKLWQQAGLPVVTVFVNLSSGALKRIEAISQDLQTDISLSGVLPGRLGLEIAEADLAGLDAVRLDCLVRLQAAGVPLAVDAFGAGITSLASLAALKPRFLKLDQSHVRGSFQHRRHADALAGAIALGRAMAIEPIAVGIESAEQAGRIESAGCRLGQGFFFGQAVDPDAAAALLKARNVTKDDAASPQDPPTRPAASERPIRLAAGT
jgi:diguanylate cyclase (GGDEF)-like protein/PAS domain S-box-containing protein